jgi:signal transduction histidine kinase
MFRRFKSEVNLTISFLAVLFAFSIGFFYIGNSIEAISTSGLGNFLGAGNAQYLLGVVLFAFGALGALIVMVLSVLKSVSNLEKKAEESERAKNEFVSLASHQLRTPLATVNWYVEVLLSGEAGETNNRQKLYLEEIYNGNQRMIELVNALIYVDLGSFVVNAKPSDLKEVCDGVIKEFSPQISRTEIQIEKIYEEHLPLVDTDSSLIWIVLQNLISNAIKYSLKGGKVVIEIKKEKEEVVISVSDNGYGIPEAQQKEIFGRLFRAKNILQKSEGTGLGLYLVKAIANQINGKVWFKSTENKGTTFYFAIPLKRIIP